MRAAADTIVIRDGTVLTSDGPIAGGDLRIEAGRITAIGVGLPTAGARVVDGRGSLVVPGFIDLHIHGAGGATFEEGRADAVGTIRSAVARHGTTAVLATLAALPPDALRAAVRAVAAARHDRQAGARISGIHLEGPYLNPERAGAQRPEWMRAPSIDEVDALQGLCDGLIRLITVAPELPGAIEFIAAARARGIAVALGHSAADGEMVERAVGAGASHVTHLFNAMGPWHHREPGLVGAALADDRLSVELICDGVHVHPRAVEIALRCKPQGAVALVSDAVAAGVAPGERTLFGSVCVVGDAVRERDSGRLAGSCLTLDAALRRLRRWLPALSHQELFAMVTATPAAVLGRAGELGALAPGRRADVVVMTTPDLAVATVVCAGQLLRCGG